MSLRMSWNGAYLTAPYLRTYTSRDLSVNFRSLAKYEGSDHILLPKTIGANRISEVI